jgi:sugar/nucleoside kinase (ribokinase family)
MAFPSPDEALAKMSGVARAQEILGESPSDSIGACLRRHLDGSGIEASFVTRIEKDESILALRLLTPRGALLFYRDPLETWRQALGRISEETGIDVLPPDLPRESQGRWDIDTLRQAGRGR